MRMVFGWAEASLLSVSVALLCEVPLSLRRPGPPRSLLSSFPPFLLFSFSSFLLSSSSLLDSLFLTFTRLTLPYLLPSPLAISSLAWLGLPCPAMPCPICLPSRPRNTETGLRTNFALIVSQSNLILFVFQTPF